MNSTQAIRYYREICGDYHPDETAENLRFTLPVSTNLVPVFVTEEHKTYYPEICVSPFISEVEYFTGTYETWTYGEPSANEDSTKKYLRASENRHLKKARFQTDIFAQTALELSQVKDALEQRIINFFEPDVIEYSEPNGWVVSTEYPTLLVNTKYNENINIIRVFEDEKTLTKSSNLTALSSATKSWYLDNTGFYLTSDVTVTDITFWALINGEVFSDTLTAHEKGFKGKKIALSRKTADKDPKVQRWTLEVVLDFEQIMTNNLGPKIVAKTQEVEFNG